MAISASTVDLALATDLVRTATLVLAMDSAHRELSEMALTASSAYLPQLQLLAQSHNSVRNQLFIPELALWRVSA